MAAAIIARLPSLQQPINRDTAAYATIGAMMQQGALPYRDVFDHKQPLVYLIYWLLNIVAPRSNAAIQLTAAAVAGLAGLVVFCCLQRCVGKTTAFLAALLLVVMGASSFVEGIDLNTEHLLVPFACLCVLLPFRFARAPRALPLVLGGGAGLAVLSKIVGVLILPASLFALLASIGVARNSWLRNIGLYALGLAIPITVVIGFYAWRGALPDLLFANFTYNFRYVGSAPKLEQNPIYYLPTPILLLVGLAVISAFLQRRGGERPAPLTIACLLWLAAAIVGAKMGHRDYPHYFAPVLPPAIILSCLWLSPVAEKFRFMGYARASAFLGVILLFCCDVLQTFGQSPNVLAVRLYGPQGQTWAYQERVGAWLREHAEPGDRLFVAGSEPGFYWASGLKPATKYIYDYPLALWPAAKAEVMQELKVHSPQYVVVPFHGNPSYLAFLRIGRYRRATQFEYVSIFEKH